MEKSKIEIDIWWKCNGMLYNRDRLPINHPEHTYNYIKNKLNLIPEEYGVYHPLKKKYENLSKDELIGKLIEMEIELEETLKYV